MPKKSTRKPATKKSASPTEACLGKPEPAFPIVGIGASAGGLEALEQFLTGVPSDSGMAFVVIQHLDPTRKGLMTELLQRVTLLSVVQVKDAMKVKPDCVYVIPPNKDMSILHGTLHLLEPTTTRGLRLPIDFFLRSLALDLRERSIGVILSGMGSDGTLGLRAIKGKAGVALVQEPASAKFDGMPCSAINSGLADIIAPAGELPDKILAYLKRAPLVDKSDMPLGNKSESGLQKVIILLRGQTDHDFSLYKQNTLCRRIERRMGIHQIEKLPSYIRYLQENPQELDLLFKELLIGVTNFFRDPAAWEKLRDHTLPELLAGRADGKKTLRAWVPGCSTGEEAYSLAMVFKEPAEQARPKENFSMQIFATDLNQDAIDKARQGFYKDTIVADVPQERLQRYFVKEEHGYRVRKDIREMVIFAPQNLVMDPPFTKLDILCCRNLLIYFTAEAQKKLMPLFHYSLNPGGVLFLGSSETIDSFTSHFGSLNTKARLYRRAETSVDQKRIEFPTTFTASIATGSEPPLMPKPSLNLQTMADQLILQRYAPPSVLANDKGDILYTSLRTGKYFEPAAGKANWNIFAMAREGLSLEVGAAFHKALRQENSVTLHGLKVETGSGTPYVDVTAQRLDADGPLRGLVMIVFTDVAADAKEKDPAAKRPTRNARQTELEHELQQVRAEARVNHEEMQTSQEEFRSTNEELQSTNEELQSTIEELTTSKEEMQSLNEELQTVNAELQSKVDELSRVGSDMKNLLDSTDIATLFLDDALQVRRFTPQTAKIIKLIPSDAGRPITDLTTELHYPELTEDAQEVLRTLNSVEKQIDTRDGRWFTVRIMPYQTLDNRIDGVVITFAEITVAKTLEAQLRATQAGLEERVAKQSTKLAQQKKRAKA